MTTAGSRGRMPMHTRMLIGFVFGAGAGLLTNFFATEAGWLDGLIRYVSDPVGQIFLRLLFMLVVPLVFSALVLGVVEIGDPRSLGRIGGRTLAYILVVTGVSVTLGLVIANLVQPGRGLPPDLGQRLLAESSERAGAIATGSEAISGIHLLINIVPRNPVASAAAVHPAGALRSRRDRCGRCTGRLPARDRNDSRDVRYPARRHRPGPGRRPAAGHVSHHGQRRRRSGRFRDRRAFRAT